MAGGRLNIQTNPNKLQQYGLFTAKSTVMLLNYVKSVLKRDMTDSHEEGPAEEYTGGTSGLSKEKRR